MRRATLISMLLALLAPRPAAGNAALHTAPARAAAELPGVDVPVAQLLADAPAAIDRALLRARPLVRRVAPRRAGVATLLVLGLPGRSTSSESMLRFLVRGLAGSPVAARLVVATLQDPVTGGPVRQGLATRQRRNRWLIDGPTTRVLHRLLTATARAEACSQVFIVGYSSGGAAAVHLAARFAGHLGAARVEGAIAIGASGDMDPAPLRAARLRVLFVTAPDRRAADHDVVQADRDVRRHALRNVQLLRRGGVTAYLREVASARHHSNWHWGIISPCRLHALAGAHEGPGIWPDYDRPSSETLAYVIPFLQGQEPPANANTVVDCPR